jgi:hypothetical protein
MGGMVSKLIKFGMVILLMGVAFALGEYFAVTRDLAKLFVEQTLEDRNEAGKVLKIKGNITSEYDYKKRKLKMGDAIFEGDVLASGPLSRLRVRMVDGAILSMGERTRILVENYRFDDGSDFDESADDKLSMPNFTIIKTAHAEEEPPPEATDQAGKGANPANLFILSGTFKLNSGQLAHLGLDKPFTIRSPIATIGVRGTTIWARMSEESTAVKGVKKGGKLDTICMVPTCSVKKGGKEQVMDRPNTGIEMAVQDKVPPPPQTVPPEKILNAQISTIVPKELPKQEVKKISDSLTKKFLKATGSMEQAKKLARSALQTAVAKAEISSTRKVLKKIQKQKKKVSEKKIRDLLAEESKKDSTQEEFNKNVEEIMKLKEQQESISDADIDQVEQEEYSQELLTETINETVEETSEAVAKAVEDGVSIEELITDEEVMLEAVSKPEQAQEIPEPTDKDKKPERSIEEEIRQKLEEEKRAKQKVEQDLKAHQQEIERLMELKKELEASIEQQEREKEKAEEEADSGDGAVDKEPEEIPEEVPEEDTDEEEAPQEAERWVIELFRDMMSGEKIFEVANGLVDNADFLKVLNKPLVRDALINGDYAALTLDSDFRKLMQHPVVQQMINNGAAEAEVVE